MKHTYIAFLIAATVFIMGMFIINGGRPTEDLKSHCTYLKQNMCVVEAKDSKAIETVDISKLDQSKFTIGQEVVYKVETPQQQYQTSLLFLTVLSIIVFLVARFIHYIFRIDFLHGIDF